MADEVCLQQHLLTLGFLIAINSRTDPAAAAELGRKQFAGIAGLTSERLRRALGLGTDDTALAQVLRLHPAWNPLRYSGVQIDHEDIGVRLRLSERAGAVADGVWPSLIEANRLAPLEAMARGVNPRYTAHVVHDTDEELAIAFLLGDKPFAEAGEVAITRFSAGADFRFADRGIPLPLTVV